LLRSGDNRCCTGIWWRRQRCSGPWCSSVFIRHVQALTRGIVACPTMMPLDWTAVCCAVSSDASNRGYSCEALHTESLAEGKWRAGVSVFAAGVRAADGLCTAAAGRKDIFTVAHG
jgi:hypothetical protein